MAEQLTLDLGIHAPRRTVLEIEDSLIEAGWMNHRDPVLDADVAAAHLGPILPAAYDWAYGPKKGEPVQTWVCCVCGGVDINPWQLSVNHNCHGGRGMCSDGRRRNSPAVVVDEGEVA